MQVIRNHHLMARGSYDSCRKLILVTLLKMLQSDWLMKCKDIVIMTLRGAKTIFLDTLLRNNRKDVTLTMVRVLLRKTASLLTFIMNVLIL